MTYRECAIVTAYTGISMLKGEALDEFYTYLKEIMGREIYTHEIPYLSEEIKKKSEKDFFQLCATAKNKR